MKVNLLLSTVLSAALLMACGSQKPLVASVTPSVVQNSLIRGSWRLTYLQDNGVDKGMNFSGYTLLFTDNRAVTVSNGTTTVKGNWEIHEDNGQQKLKLTFPSAPAMFESLAKDWNITGASTTRMRLNRDNSSGGKDSFYIFKNGN